MKEESIRVLIVSFLVCLMIVSGFIPSINNGFANVRGDGLNLIQFIPSHDPIRINSDLDFTAGNGVVSGNGSKSNPYVITDYYINGTGAGFCVYIGNTTSYFLLNNLYIDGARGPSGQYYWETGLILNNVTNGLVKNCEFYENNGSGIYMKDSNNNTILTNEIYDNFGEGIKTDNSIYNTLNNNNLSYNNRRHNWIKGGLVLYQSNKNTLELNDIHNNPIYGLRVWYSDNNHIAENEINYNCGGEAGVYFEYSDNNLFQNNNVSNGTGDGVQLYFSHNNRIVNNTANDNYYNGFSGYQASRNLYENNTVLNNKYGYGYILYLNCDFSRISNNTIGNNYYQGIDIEYSDNCTLFNNDIFGHEYSGITLAYSADNILAENTVWNNNQIKSTTHAGIKLTGSDKNTLDNNTVSTNPIFGVMIYDSHKNLLKYNDIIKNCGGNAGLYLDGSDYNRIIQNNISNSTGDGILMYSSDYNLFDHNLLEYNLQNGGSATVNVQGTCYRNVFSNNTIENTVKNFGMFFGGKQSYNVIKHNNIGYNGKGGIFIQDSNNFTIFDNYIYWNYNSGIYLYNCKDFELLENTVWENNQMMSWSLGGIVLDLSPENILDKNYVHNNPKYGVYINNYSNNNLIQNNDIIFNCGGESGLYIYNSHSNQVLTNNISNSTGNGILLEQATFNLIDDNTVNGNNADGTGAGGIILSLSSHNNTITNNTVMRTFKSTAIGVYSNSNFNTIAYNHIGYNNRNGIEIGNSHNCTIFENEIYWNDFGGIRLSGTKYIQIFKNEIWENNQGLNFEGGVFLLNSFKNTIVENYIHNNPEYGIMIDGTSSNYNVIELNDILFNCGGEAGIGLYGGFYAQILQNNISNGTGIGVMIYSENDYTIMDKNIITGNDGNGIYIDGAKNCEITNNIINNNNKKSVGTFPQGGIAMINAPSTVIHNNEINKNENYGIYLQDSENTTISHNEIINNTNTGIIYDIDKDAVDDYTDMNNNTIIGNSKLGLAISNGYHNIKHNFISENKKHGAYIESDSNNITYNTFYKNAGYGIQFDLTTGNVVHHNNFVDNNASYMQCFDNSGTNSWDNGTEGNYWSDYESIYVPPAKHDGKVWDLPYNLSGKAGAKDNYPLAYSLGVPGITDNSPTAGTTGDNFTFSCKINTIILMDGVYIYYWFGSNIGSAVNASMTETATDNYELTIILPSSSVDPMKYYIHAFNVIDGNTSIGYKTVPITDNDPPIAAAGPDLNIDSGNYANFNGAGSFDNIGVVNYTWTFEYDGFTTELYGAQPNFLFNLPDVYDVTLTVKDAADYYDTDDLIVTVNDQDKPTIMNVEYPATVFIGDAFKILVNITDIGGIYVVKIDYTDVNANNYYVNMNPDDTYDYGFTVPGQPTVGFVTFFIWVNDTSSNWEQSELFKVEVLDNIKPVIHNVEYPSQVETGTGITVIVNATDNIEIDYIRIYYQDVNGINYSSNMTKGSGSEYEFTIPGQVKAGKVGFYVFVIDTYDNFAESIGYAVDVTKKVVELTRPEIDFLELPAEKYIDENILIKVEVTDPAGVDKVYLNYTAVNNSVYNLTMSQTRGIYTLTIPGQKATGTIKLFVLASNLKGNWNKTMLKTIIISMVPPPIKDLYPPYVVSISPKNGDTNVSVGTKIVIKFNESMNRSSVKDALILSHDLNMSFFNVYDLVWSDNNKTLTIIFEENLTHNTTYFITIDTKAKDLANNKLKSKFESKFRTAAETKDQPPKITDEDGDGMDDDWEREHGFDPTDPSDAEKDFDGDGLSNKEEFELGLNPKNKDTDGDGMPDGWEVKYGLNPKVNDANSDIDGDGYTNLEEYEGGSDPTKSSSVPTEKKEDKKDNTMLLLLLVIIIVVVIALLAVMSRRKKKPEEEPEAEEDEAGEEEEEDEMSESDEDDRAEQEAEEDDLEDEAEEAEEELDEEEAEAEADKEVVDDEPEEDLEDDDAEVETEEPEDSEDEPPIEEEADDEEEEWEMPAEEKNNAPEKEGLKDDDEEWEDWDSSDDDEIIEDDEEWEDWDEKV